MAENKPTVDEHYIPQCYLKQFSPDAEKIYEYDALNKKQIPVPVPTESICYEKNLYEFKDASGAYVYRNLIEKNFALFEGEFANTFRSIRSKIHNEANYQTLSFLTEKEKALLVFFLSTMILRRPDILKAAQDYAMEYFGNKVTEISARNFVLQTCLPIYKKLDVEEQNLLNPIMKFFDDMSFIIGVTDKRTILTSDNPIVLFRDNGENYHPTEVILPLSSCSVLNMTSYSKTKRNCYNRLYKMKNEDIRYVNQAVVTQCKRWIFSEAPLTDKMIRWITKERSNL